jgi:hypothetical protein
LLHPGEKPAWTSGRIDDKWHLEGVVAGPASGSDTRVSETEKNERHLLETKISDLVPDRYYLLTITYKPVGNRVINLILRDDAGGHEGVSYCDPTGGNAGRRGDAYDGSMVLKTDGSVVCWGIVKLTHNTAVLGIDLLPQKGGFPYQGDGRSGLLVQDISLYIREAPDIVLNTEARH